MCLLIGVNYFGDASHLFSSDYEKRVTDLLLQGKNVTNIANYDERLVQKEIITKMVDSREIIILGSSRTMLIRDDYLNSDVFNYSVSGASLEDLIAIYQILRTRKIKLEKVILGIDPWMFNKYNEREKWISLSAEYYAFMGVEKDVTYWARYKQLISPSYFQNSIKLLFDYSVPVATSKKKNKALTKLSDGSLVYGEEYRSVTPEKLEDRVNRYLNGDIYALSNFSEVSAEYTHLFQRLIKDIKENDIEVVFFLSPYHPRVFRRIESKYKMVLEVEEYINQFAIQKDIKVVGSYDPFELQMDSTYFYDAMHLKEKGVKKILAGLKEE